VAGNANKTMPGGGDADAFIAAVADEQRRDDPRLVVALMREATGEPAVMWGSSIVGFGARHYRYATGREGDVPAVGFSPRKAQTVLYLTGQLDDYADLLGRVGPHKAGKGCLHFKRVDQNDRAVLREIIVRSYQAAAAVD